MRTRAAASIVGLLGVVAQACSGLPSNGREVVSAFVWTIGDPSIATVSLKPGLHATIGEVQGRAEGKTLRVEMAGQPGLSEVDQLEVIKPNTEKPTARAPR